MSGQASQKMGSLRARTGARKRIPMFHRTRCDNCPGKSRSGQWVDWYGHKMYLCPQCLIAAKNVLKEDVMKEAGHAVER